MSDFKRRIVHEITKMLDSAKDADAIKIKINEQKDSVTIEEIDKFIEIEVEKAVFFYESRGKINNHQANNISKRAINMLKKETVISEDKVKHIVKDYIIHVLASELKQMQQ